MVLNRIDAERKRSAEQPQAEAICEQVRQDLIVALNSPDAEIVVPSRYTKGNRIQKVIIDTVPSETGPVEVEIRGYLPAATEPEAVAATSAEHIFIRFPSANNELYSFGKGFYRNARLKNHTWPDLHTDVDRLISGEYTMMRNFDQYTTRVPLSDASHLQYRVAQPIVDRYTNSLPAPEAAVSNIA